jgi:hypothetical protein
MIKKAGEWTWFVLFGIISTLWAGYITDFKFTDIQFVEDAIYGRFNALRFIIYLTLLLYTLKNIFQLVQITASRNQVLAIVASIIFPLATLLLFFFFKPLMSDAVQEAAMRTFYVFLFLAVTAVFFAVEVVCLKKVVRFLHDVKV